MEYDIGCEDIIARHGSVDGPPAEGREARVPCGDHAAADRDHRGADGRAPRGALADRRHGGLLLRRPAPRRGPPRARRPAARPARCPSGGSGPNRVSCPRSWPRIGSDGFSIRRAAGDPGILFHHRRRLSDGELVFLANTSDRDPSAGSIVSPARGVERWDIETGQVGPVLFREKEGVVALPFELPPCGSALYLLTWEPRQAAPERRSRGRRSRPSGARWPSGGPTRTCSRSTSST